MFLTLVILSFVSVVAQASLSVEKVLVSGSGCYGDKKITSGAPDTYFLPARLRLDKTKGSALERKSCSLRWPLKIEKHKKIQIFNVAQDFKVSQLGAAPLKASLKVSLAGSKSEDILIEAAKAGSYPFKKTGLLAESKCGKDDTVMVNLSAFVAGEGEARAEANSLSLEVKTVKCN